MRVKYKAKETADPVVQVQGRQEKTVSIVIEGKEVGRYVISQQGNPC